MQRKKKDGCGAAKCSIIRGMMRKPNRAQWRKIPWNTWIRPIMEHEIKRKASMHMWSWLIDSLPNERVDLILKVPASIPLYTPETWKNPSNQEPSSVLLILDLCSLNITNSILKNFSVQDIIFIHAQIENVFYSSSGVLQIMASTAWTGPCNSSQRALYTICWRCTDLLPSNLSDTTVTEMWDPLGSS